MDDDRLIDLETRIAYQDDLLETLNDIVASQQQQLDQLHKICHGLLEHLHELSAAVAKGPLAVEHEIPPHY
ncbi:SlyX family protein [Isoalcanivorax beigongshangi]|uniref:SlyX family protein n=1 Tax=Isoalcanivorax beigongshangi TaxID=3238810 RepID=A0ABV4AD34_9GAMM